MATPSRQSDSDGPKLGTFGGVFTPSVLTILGIILFLRLGFVVGSAGLTRALVIIGLANAISVLTSISLSAIATNLNVKGGGDYYLISRTLGVEFGGALGLVLFLAQSVSIAFYCIGFGEAVSALLSHPLATPRILAFAATGALFVLAWLGADVATRFQFGVMGILAAALLSFFAGGIANWESAVLAGNWGRPADGPGFWILFAIFFPAVTGFTQGVSMSGDLADPGKSLPLGTFLAVGVSILVYFAVAVLFAGNMPLADLQADYGAMGRVAAWGFLIDAGVIAATLSSAMASFLGAPRILQSLAADRIFSFLAPFAKGYGPTQNPRRGVLLSLVIALLTIAMGNLNLVASVVSMFFLISYGLLNYATYFEARTGSPSFRPRFRYFDKRLSLAGAAACLGVMLAIDPKTSLVAVAILFAVYQYLRRTAGPSRWADSRRSYHLQQVREHLLGAAEDPEHARDWRPHILALSNHPERRDQLLRLAEWIEGESGFTTAVQVLEGTGGAVLRRQAESEEAFRQDIAKKGFGAFPLVVRTSDMAAGFPVLVQSYGIGPVKANTVLLNWYSPRTEGDPGRRERLIRILGGAYRLGCNILIARFQEAIEGAESGDGRQIDIWWQENATGRLCLLLAHLMKRSAEWQSARLRVLTVEKRYRGETGRTDLEQEIVDARIDAEVEICEMEEIQHAVAASAQSHFVFLPMRFEKDRILSLTGRPASELLRWLPSTVLVRAAEDIELGAEPESGEAAERAKVQDALDDARRKAAEAAKDADQAVRAAAEAAERLGALKAAGSTGEASGLSEAEADARKAEKAAEKATRRAAKALAKKALAESDAEDMGIYPPGEDD